MGASIRPTLTLMLGGTSLTAGRLCTPPLPWTRYLLEDMMAAPECLGPVRIINTGQGSQTSNFGASQAALMAPLRPTHVLMEDFGINDCAMGVTIPQATANFNSMVASYRLANPDVIICHQTMSPASQYDALRTNLPAYYTNGLANAALNGLESLDNYYGTVLVPGGWVKPLPLNLTVPVDPPPSGFSAWTGTWNPADKSASITLSGGDLTATSSGTNAAVRNTVQLGSGKYFYQVSVAVNSSCSIGVMNGSNSLAVFVGSGVDSCGYRSNGSVYVEGSSVASYASYTDGDLILGMFDLSAHKAWFSKNGVVQSGDPIAGTGGVPLPNSNLFPAVSGSSGAVMVADFVGALGDGLHPVWPNAFVTYSYPNILAWARRMMADFW